VRGEGVTASDQNPFDDRVKVLQYVVVADSQDSVAKFLQGSLPVKIICGLPDMAVAVEFDS
jgi:hypothetical protein